MALVLQGEGDDSLGSLLCTFLSAAEANGLLVAEAASSCVVQVGQVKGIMREMLSVELYQLGVPFLCQLPNHAAREFHYA